MEEDIGYSRYTFRCDCGSLTHTMDVGLFDDGEGYVSMISDNSSKLKRPFKYFWDITNYLLSDEQFEYTDVMVSVEQYTNLYQKMLVYIEKYGIDKTKKSTLYTVYLEDGYVFVNNVLPEGLSIWGRIKEVSSWLFSSELNYVEDVFDYEKFNSVFAKDIINGKEE